MGSFGDKLRQERESRGVSLDEISGATGVDRVYLEALEENRFELLTGPAFGKLYVRAYGALLGFDPEPLIEDYDRERYSQRRESEAAATVKVGPEAGEAETDGNGAKPPESATRAPVAAPHAGSPAVLPVPPPEPSGESVHPAAVEPEDRALEDESTREVPRVAPRSLVTLVATALVSLALVLALAWGVRSIFGRSGEEEATPLSASQSPTDAEVEEPMASSTNAGTRTGAATKPAAGARPGGAGPSVTSREAEGGPESPTPLPATEGTLSVPEYGVGRRVVDRRLEGQDDRFEEGSTACFLTRVLGGRAGETIRHVWLHEGRVVQTIELRLGGPHWRTHSRKTLHGLGPWTVEARDSSGGVLARASFACVEPVR